MSLQAHIIYIEKILTICNLQYFKIRFVFIFNDLCLFLMTLKLFMTDQQFSQRTCRGLDFADQPDELGTRGICNVNNMYQSPYPIAADK